MNASASQGCGSAHCACSGQLQIVPASINGVALHEPGQALDADTLRERAWAELLRQRAVHLGRLPRVNVLVAPELGWDVVLMWRPGYLSRAARAWLDCVRAIYPQPLQGSASPALSAPLKIQNS